MTEFNGCDYHFPPETPFDPEGEDTRKAALNAIVRDLTRWTDLTGPAAMKVASQSLSTLELEGFVEFCPCDYTGKDL
jgi:hypothetical protein